MEKWIEIRRRVLGGEISKRAACEEYDIHWDTLTKILTHTFDAHGLPVAEQDFDPSLPCWSRLHCDANRHKSGAGVSIRDTQPLPPGEEGRL